MIVGDDDKHYWNLNQTIIGIDEVGKGSIAGDLYIGLVCFQFKYPDVDYISCISSIGLNDSKKLSNKKRFALEDNIKEISRYKIVKVSSNEINTGENLNTLIFSAINKGLEEFDDHYVVFMDGNQSIPNTKFTQVIKPKFDSLSWSVAAASILAKNEQVRAMLELDKLYPEYGFKNHNGYGTKEHKEAIKKYGVLGCHRKNWIK